MDSRTPGRITREGLADLAEITSWFRENRKTIPRSMGNDFMIVNNAGQAIEDSIKEVNAYVKKYGKQARKVHAARAAFGRLKKLYEMAVDENTHNTGELKSDFWREMSKRNTKPC